MDENLKQSIAKAKELWRTARHAAMATVNADGSPHNTPFRFMRDPERNYIYWASYPEALHSENVLRTGKIFVVLYDAVEVKKGGLYLSAEDGHILEGEELARALEINNELRAEEGKGQLTAEYYSGTSPQRMWAARVTRAWVNNAVRDASGQVTKTSRQEVRVTDVLN